MQREHLQRDTFPMEQLISAGLSLFFFPFPPVNNSLTSFTVTGVCSKLHQCFPGRVNREIRHLFLCNIVLFLKCSSSLPQVYQLFSLPGPLFWQIYQFSASCLCLDVLFKSPLTLPNFQLVPKPVLFISHSADATGVGSFPLSGDICPVKSTV